MSDQSRGKNGPPCGLMPIKWCNPYLDRKGMVLSGDLKCKIGVEAGLLHNNDSSVSCQAILATANGIMRNEWYGLLCSL